MSLAAEHQPGSCAGQTIQYDLDVRYLTVVGNVAAFAGAIVENGPEHDLPALVVGGLGARGVGS